MEPDLLASRCKSCGQIFFPKKRVCSNCLSIDNMEAKKLGRRGRLISYTINHVSAPGFEAPYAFGYIELSEGIKIYSILKIRESFEELAIGMDVELSDVETADDEFGKGHVKWRFMPVIRPT